MPRRNQPDPLAVQLGARVRELREAAGLTLEKLAYESDLGSKGHLSDVESGRVRPTAHTLAVLADRLGVELIDLVTFPRTSLRHMLIDRTRGARDAELRRAMGQLPAAATVEAFREVKPTARQKFRSSVPLLALDVAAGAFGRADLPTDTQWVVPRTRRRLRRGMFVARITGRSMEPLLVDGSYALFDANVRPPLARRVVLVQRGGLHEGEGFAADFTVKRFEGRAKLGEHGVLRVQRARLLAENARFAPIELGTRDEVRIVAQLVTTLPEE